MNLSGKVLRVTPVQRSVFQNPIYEIELEDKTVFDFPMDNAVIVGKTYDFYRHSFHYRLVLQMRKEEGWEMTDAELAKEIAHCFVRMPKKGSCKADKKDALLYRIMFQAREELQDKIAAAFKRIRTEENEKCAVIVDSGDKDKGLDSMTCDSNGPHEWCYSCINDILNAKAAAIRARSGKKGEGAERG